MQRLKVRAGPMGRTLQPNQRAEATTDDCNHRREYDEALSKAFHFIDQDRIEGDYLEFGVYQGASLLTAYSLAQQRQLRGMRIFGFDSFRGFPAEPSEVVPVHFGEGRMACPRSEVERLFPSEVLRNDVVVVEGMYECTLTAQTAAQYRLKRAAIVNIDCDLYSSTAAVLRFVLPILQEGTLIFFDDWFCNRGSSRRGEQRAFHEWCAGAGSRFTFADFLRYGIHGVVKVCDRVMGW